MSEEKETEKSKEKKPRLFYYEETLEGYCPVWKGLEVENIIDIDSFTKDGEEITITLKRFDMTDEELNNLPEAD